MRKHFVTGFLVLIISTNIFGQSMTSSLQQELSQKSSSIDFGSSKAQFPTLSTIDSFTNIRDKNSDIYKINDNSTTAIDRSINPEQYLLGCGDALLIYIWGATEKTIQITLNTEGVVILPLIGPFDLDGKSLSQAKQELTAKILGEYKNTKCTIELKSMRQFKIYITGNIARPGSYIVNAVTRASEAILAAGWVSKKGKIRGIIIKNDTYGNKELDLSTFLNSSDIEKNPYLKEGDQIFVPVRNEIVTVNGSISHPGDYDFFKGDNLKTIILTAGDFSRDADKSNIIITRFLNNSDSLETIILRFPEDEKTEIKPDDRIMVTSIPNYRISRQVYISGEVVYPGVYPIRNDKTTLKEIIKAAGGLTPQSSLFTSKINRKSQLGTGDREYDRLKTYPSQIMNPLELSYLKARSKEEDGHVSLDFEKALHGNNDISNIILCEDDEIIIAKKELSIKISGAVASPGLVPFIDGKNIHYYIQQTGGFLSNAKKSDITVVMSGTNIFKPISKVKQLNPGDVIIVPEKEYRNPLIFTKDMLMIIGSVATIILSMISVNNYFNGD